MLTSSTHGRMIHSFTLYWLKDYDGDLLVCSSCCNNTTSNRGLRTCWLFLLVEEQLGSWSEPDKLSRSLKTGNVRVPVDLITSCSDTRNKTKLYRCLCYITINMLEIAHCSWEKIQLIICPTTCHESGLDFSIQYLKPILTQKWPRNGCLIHHSIVLW